MKTASEASPTELGGLGSILSPPFPQQRSQGQSPLKKYLGPKSPLDWLKIGLNLARRNYAYIFENTPKKANLEKRHGGGRKGGGGRVNSGALVIAQLTSVMMLHANTSSLEVYCWTQPNWWEPFGTMPQVPCGTRLRSRWQQTEKSVTKF